jgi:hypothetical protein
VTVGVSIRGLMMDRAGGVVQERFAVVYAPKKKKRLSANCVEVMESEQAARESSNPERHRYAAVVAGPSTSSESQQLYYLVRWLN